MMQFRFLFSGLTIGFYTMPFIHSAKNIGLMLCAVPILASCASIVDGSTQIIHFRTIAADDAKCDVALGDNDYKYTVRPPQSININKTGKQMVIDCYAPGNRNKKVIIDPSFVGTSYAYPSEISIDFTSTDSVKHPYPAYENEGALPVKDQGIEYLGPDVPSLNEDRVQIAPLDEVIDDSAQIAKEQEDFKAERARRINTVEGGFYGDKDKKPTDKKVTSDPQSILPPADGVTVPKEVTPTRKYNPPKVNPAEMSDGTDMLPMPLSDSVPVQPLDSGAEPALSITPLSQVMPDMGESVVVGSANTPSVSVTPLDELAMPSGPQLTQPIFPSSTSF